MAHSIGRRHHTYGVTSAEISMERLAYQINDLNRAPMERLDIACNTVQITTLYQILVLNQLTVIIQRNDTCIFNNTRTMIWLVLVDRDVKLDHGQSVVHDQIRIGVITGYLLGLPVGPVHIVHHLVFAVNLDRYAVRIHHIRIIGVISEHQCRIIVQRNNLGKIPA